MPLPLRHLIRPWLPTPDPRSDEDLSRDLEDEFTFHLARLEEELAADGHDAAAAHDLARRRFGDVDSIRRACVRIARKEERMLQKMNLVLMIVVLLMLAAVSVQMWRAQSAQTEAIRSLGEQLVALRVGSTAAPAPQELPGQVYVGGSVARPGVYTLPPSGRMTLLQLLTSAGSVITAGSIIDHEISITRGEGQMAHTTTYRLSTVRSNPSTAPIVESNDYIEVSAIRRPSETDVPGGTDGTVRPPFRVPTQPPLEGVWEHVADESQPEATRWLLTIKGTDDITNLSGSPLGSLRAPGIDHPIGLRFKSAAMPSSGSNLEILDSFERAGYLQHGRAILSPDGSTLTLNLSTAPGAPPGAERLVFTKVSTDETTTPPG